MKIIFRYDFFTISVMHTILACRWDITTYTINYPKENSTLDARPLLSYLNLILNLIILANIKQLDKMNFNDLIDHYLKSHRFT